MPQKFVNLENLTSFWGNAKEYIGNERKEIEDQLYNWQKTEKAPIVQCEPVPNSDLHPIVDFMFTETPPAEGEKGLDNPSTITGVDSITVTRANKNLLSQDFSSLTAHNGETVIKGQITCTNNNGVYSLSGTASGGNISIVFALAADKELYLHPGTYYISGFDLTDSSPTMFVQTYDDNGGSLSAINSRTPTSFTITNETAGWGQVFIWCGKGNSYPANFTCSPQLEIGSSATGFEKGVSVDTTINLGSTQYGGSLDVATGKMTVTWIKKILDRDSLVAAGAGFTWNGSNKLFKRFFFRLNGAATGFPAIKNITHVTCSHFKRLPVASEEPLQVFGTFTVNEAFDRWCMFYDYDMIISDESKTGSENTNLFLNWFEAKKQAGDPVYFIYELKEPQIIQLTPQQIKSLPSLEGTSKRINTIYTDADSIQVEYQKYVGVDSTLDNTSENAIQNKVVNSALNTKVSLTGDEVIAGSKTFSSPINGSVTGDAGTVAGHIVSKDVPVNAAFTDTTYEPATQSTAGLMSASDKVKLDAVGSVFTFKGSVTDSSSLPASDNASGDAYLAEDTGHVHVYDGTSFVDIGTWAGIPSATDAQIDALFED